MHFLLQDCAELMYKNNNIAEAIQYCELDISIAQKYIKVFLNEDGHIPDLKSFRRLCIIYKNGK